MQLSRHLNPYKGLPVHIFAVVLQCHPQALREANPLYAQLLITGLFCLTKTIKCSTFKWRLPRADLGEDDPSAAGITQTAECSMSDPGEGLRKCFCTATGCHGSLRSGHRRRKKDEHREEDLIWLLIPHINSIR